MSPQISQQYRGEALGASTACATPPKERPRAAPAPNRRQTSPADDAKTIRIIIRGKTKRDEAARKEWLPGSTCAAPTTNVACGQIRVSGLASVRNFATSQSLQASGGLQHHHSCARWELQMLCGRAPDLKEKRTSGARSSRRCSTAIPAQGPDTKYWQSFQFLNVRLHSSAPVEPAL